MPISFPTNPDDNDTHVIGSITYQYNATDDKWTGLGISPSDRLVEGSNSLEINASNNLVWTGNNVGIGTSAPQAKLQVQNTQGGQFGRILFDANVSSGYDTRIDATDVGLEFTAKSNSRGFAFNTGSTPTPKVNIDASGRLLVGTSTARSINTTNAWRGVQIAGTTGYESLIIERYEGSGGPPILLGKSRGTSVGDYTVVQNNDGLGSLIFFGSDGSDMNSQGARIDAYVDGTPGANDMPGRLVFSTNPGSPATGPTERLHITSDGSVSIGGFSTPGALLHLRDSNNTTKGAAQLKISKGIGSGAAPISVSRADSYIHLGGSEWGSGANGLYIMGFGYTGGETGTGLPAYIGYRETSTSGYTLGDLTFGTRPNTDGTNAGRERMKITSKGVRQYPCANDSTFAYQGNYQQLSGKKQLIGSGNFTDIVAHGHSCSYLLQYHLLQNDNNSLGGGPGTAYLHVRYGSSGYSNHVHQVGGMNGGSLNSPEIVYINSGSKLTFRASWSGSDPVFLYWHLSGCGNTLLTAL